MRKLDNDYIANLNKVLAEYGDMDTAIREYLNEDNKEIALVGCGANYSQMLLVNHLFTGLSKKVRCSVYHGGEFERKVPDYVDKNTVVIGMSHSGNTTEIYRSLKKVKEQKNSIIVGISSNANSKIANISDIHFTYPDGENMSEMKIINLYQITSIILELHNEPWPEVLQEGIEKLPDILYRSHERYEEIAKEFAKKNKNRSLMYTMGCGPTMGAAFAFGNCKLMEMQWKNAGVLNASNFFHGPLEIVDDKSYFLLFKSQDRLSEHVARVEEYFSFKKANYDVIDTNVAYTYKDSYLKEYISPVLLWPAMTVYAWALEDETGHDLDLRRNMGKKGTDYFNNTNN